MPRTARALRNAAFAAGLAFAALATPAHAAQKLVATVADADFDIPSTPVTRTTAPTP